MWFGRIGGALVIGGCALCLFALAIVAGGGSGDSGLESALRLIESVALMPISLGAAILAATGPKPLSGRALRVGLVSLALGLSCYLVATNVPVPAGSNSLQVWPIVIGLGVGYATSLFGLVLTRLSLVRRPGQLRRAGVLLLVGLWLIPLAVLVTAWSSGGGFPLGLATGVLGLVGIFLGGIGIGVLAIRGDRSELVA